MKMSKEKNVKMNNVVENGKKFIDGIDKKWLVNEQKKTIVFCETINELLNGEVEQHEFIEKIVSTRTVTRKEKTKEKNDFIIFVLTNNDMILVRPWKELK